jgi:RNA polymerase sigma-70 factor (ECF subfamily)
MDSLATRPEPDSWAENPEELRNYLRRGLRRAISGVDDAEIEDFTQEALVHILRRRDSFKGESRFSTWAMAVALRVAFTALRRRRYRERVVDIDTELAESVAALTSGVPDPQRGSERADLMTTLRRAIAEDLTERQRSAVLGELQGVPSEALAERLGIKRNALYKLHHDARKKLRGAILAAGYSSDDVAQVLRGE